MRRRDRLRRGRNFGGRNFSSVHTPANNIRTHTALHYSFARLSASVRLVFGFHHPISNDLFLADMDLRPLLSSQRVPHPGDFVVFKSALSLSPA
jgi:hypothetical protein